MKPNLNELLKQVQKMQADLDKFNTEFGERTFEFDTGAGAVNVTINGKKEILALNIQKEIINPDDKEILEDLIISAVNKAIREVEIITYGNDSAKESIRKALAMGADKGILIKGDLNVDSLTVAEALASEILQLNPDIIFCGKQSVDYDSSAVGQMLAELLNIPSISTVVKLEIENGKVRAEREVEGGVEIVESSLPIVITAQKGLNEPRYASLKGIMAAKSKPIEEKNFETSMNRLIVNELKLPESKRKSKIVGTDASAVAELVRLLREEAKVI